MPRWTGTTTERGYGHEHRKERRRRLANWKPGDPCTYCGKAMLGPPAYIDLGHTPDRTAYTGLMHRHCNRSEGAYRGNLMRGRMRIATGPSRRW